MSTTTINAQTASVEEYLSAYIIAEIYAKTPADLEQEIHQVYEEAIHEDMQINYILDAIDIFLKDVDWTYLWEKFCK